MKNELHTLQIVRGVAAMMVVTNHLWGTVFGGIFKYNGGLGVDIFFVLSGFLMVFTQKETRGPIEFLSGRIFRIYPMYILVSLPLIIMMVEVNNPFKILSNLFLIPTFGQLQHRLANDPAWTLVYEMIFYVMFSASLLISRNKVKSCLMVCTMLLFSVYLFSFYLAPQPRFGWINLGYILGDSLLIDFGMGCLLAILYEKINYNKRLAFPLFVALTLGVIYASLIYITGPRIIKFGLPALVIITLAIYSSHGHGVIYKILHVIGDASYSIYLSHLYFAWAMHNSVNTKDIASIDAEVATLLFTGMCIAFGIFINITVERPIMRYVADRKKARRAMTV
ncbi:acyltransferase [Cronobacter sakazakii]|nr:acyltransferase [Cronobacter sakazakii]ELY7492192.1 acyltransferase [Cronobacter sakazakii]